MLSVHLYSYIINKGIAHVFTMRPCEGMHNFLHRHEETLYMLELAFIINTHHKKYLTGTNTQFHILLYFLYL